MCDFRLYVAGLLLVPACGRMPKGPPPSPGVVETICGTPQAGSGARIVVWRRADDGSIVTLELLPPPASDAPTVFYDETGREELTVPTHPVQPSSPEALEIQRREEMVTEDGKKAETLHCRK